MNFEKYCLSALTQKAADEIGSWEYDKPFAAYSFRGRPNGYLFDKGTWGKEQFCLSFGEYVAGQVACQWEGGRLWVGWSMNPALCGQGNGHLFVKRCVEEIRRLKGFHGEIFLRVAASNLVKDEIAYTGIQEDFCVMVHPSVF